MLSGLTTESIRGIPGYVGIAGRLNSHAEVWRGARWDATDMSLTARDRKEARVEQRKAAIECEREAAKVEAKAALLRLTAAVEETGAIVGGQSGGVVRRDNAPTFDDPEGSPPN